MISTIYKRMAKDFLKRRGRNAIPMGAPDVYENDDVFVHLATDQYGEHNYTLEKIVDDKVVFKRWERESDSYSEEEFPISVLWKGDIRVIHFVSRFTNEYFGLARSYFRVFTRIYKIRLWKSRQVERSIRIRRNRISLLRDLLQQYTFNPEATFTAEDAMTHLYGRRVIEAEKTLPFWHYTRFIIRSLVESKDLIATEEDIELSYKFKLSPSAIATLEKHDLEEKRHKRQNRIAISHFVAAAMLALVAIVNLLILFR